MSSRAPAGGSRACRTRCTRRSLLVTVPSDSAQPAAAGSTTSASSAVWVRKMSCTTRWSRRLSSRTARFWSASLRAGFSPTMYAARSSPSSTASNISLRCQPLFRGNSAPPHAFANLSCSSGFSRSWKPGRRAGIAPMSPPPCTLFCPRSGLRPHPYRPTFPVSSPRLISASTLSVALWCSVMPRVQQIIPVFARP